MNLISIKLISALLVLIVTLISGWHPFKKRHYTTCCTEYDFPIAEALASGVFLGAGLIHMLGDAAQGFYDLDYHYPFAFLLAGMTFLFLLWMEHLGREFYEHQKKNSSSFALLAVIMLSFHSLIVGSALGASNSYTMTMMILIAILAHQWVESFALATQINKSNWSFKTRITSFLLFAFTVPMGIFLASFIGQSSGEYPLIQPILMSLSAGTFLYLGTLHGLKQSVMVEKCCNLKHFSFVIIGFSLMAVVAVWT